MRPSCAPGARRGKEGICLLSNILLVFSQVCTLFVMMGVGFLLSKLGKLTKDSLSQVTFLLLYVVSPCLIVDTLQVERDAALVRSLGLGMLLMVVLYVLWVLLALPLFRGQAPDTRVVLQYGVVYGNTGFMGLPLLQAVLGPQGLLYATAPYICFNLFAWSHGIAQMGGRKSVSLKKMFINPGILGCAVGLVFFLLNFRLPALLGDAVHYLGAMNTPLAMVVIGVQMAGADIKSTFRNPRLYTAGLFKLLIMPLAALVLLLPLKLDPVMYAAYVILAATPSAGFTAIFSQEYGRDTATAAQLVTLTTLLSILTLPCFAALSQALGG